VPKLGDPAEALRVVEARDFGSDLLLEEVRSRLVAVLRMAQTLSSKYQVVVANPPYMGSSGMNRQLLDLLGSNYPFSKSDLFSAFIVRVISLCTLSGYVSLMTPTTWMFIATHKKVRQYLIENTSFTSLIQMEYNSGLLGAVAPVCAFCLRNSPSISGISTFISLKDFKGYEKQPIYAKMAINNPDSAWRYRRDKQHFNNLQNKEIAFDIPDGFAKSLANGATLASEVVASEGLKTADNARFIRFWHEVSSAALGTIEEKRTWVKHAKGGDFRLWYGNLNWVVKWNGADGVQSEPRAGFQGRENYGSKGVVWSKISNAFFAARIHPEGAIFDSACPGAFSKDNLAAESLAALLCSKATQEFIKKINPTMNFQVGNVLSVPLPLTSDWEPRARDKGKKLIEIAKTDWDAFESSWDFTTLPLLSKDLPGSTLEARYAALCARWQDMTTEMRRLAEENNRIFIESYGLKGEMTPEVPLQEVTLTCNPTYRYGTKLSEPEKNARLLEDTVAEFLNYAVGCMFGRYSLDTPGLVLANQGERLEDYLAKVPSPTFTPDKDNVIPVLDGEWFADDVTERFRKFLRVTFGEENYRENLAFVEKALGKDIRKWFTRDFFDYHVRRFKKRPIYWLFSSPKGTFQALMYMHRYRPETVSVLLNDYLREHIRKLEGHRASREKEVDDPSTPAAKTSKARKDIIIASQQIDELKDWERDVIFPLAQQRINIDLDDGVKANYPKFGAALRKIKGLEAADE